MNSYSVKLNVELEIQAFDETDARDYALDILNVDDEIKTVNIVKIKKV
jgi:hypothetical protein